LQPEFTVEDLSSEDSPYHQWEAMGIFQPKPSPKSGILHARRKRITTEDTE
jgi:hypothetical protein